MIPGKTITITSAIVNGANAKTVLNDALLTANVTGHAVGFTTKSKTTWNTRECVCFIVANGEILSAYRRNGDTIQSLGGYTTTYEISASSGQTFYIVEETP